MSCPNHRELEEALKYQLRRLEAMQNISKILYSRPIIDRDIFYGGSDEGINVKYNITYTATIFDLLKSYSSIINKNTILNSLTINLSELFSVEQSIERIKNILNEKN